MDRILNTIINIVLRRVINKGIDGGINMATGNRGGGKRPKGGHGVSEEDQAEMDAMRQRQQNAKSMKKAAKVGRRMF